MYDENLVENKSLISKNSVSNIKDYIELNGENNQIKEEESNLVILIDGPVGSGKRSMIFTHIYKKFPVDFSKYLGIDLKIYKHIIKEKLLKYIFYIPYNRYHCSLYYNKINCHLLCFDISNKSSLYLLDNYTIEDKIISLNNENIIKVIIGNKCDKNREVSFEEATYYSNSKGYAYFETSAKNNFNIENVFDYINSQYFRFKQEKTNGKEVKLQKKYDKKLKNKCSKCF